MSMCVCSREGGRTWSRLKLCACSVPRCCSYIFLRFRACHTPHTRAHRGDHRHTVMQLNTRPSAPRRPHLQSLGLHHALCTGRQLLQLFPVARQLTVRHRDLEGTREKERGMTDRGAGGEDSRQQVRTDTRSIKRRRAGAMPRGARQGHNDVIHGGNENGPEAPPRRQKYNPTDKHSWKQGQAPPQRSRRRPRKGHCWNSHSRVHVSAPWHPAP